MSIFSKQMSAAPSNYAYSIEADKSLLIKKIIELEDRLKFCELEINSLAHQVENTAEHLYSGIEKCFEKVEKIEKEK